MSITSGMLSSNSDEWETPRSLFDYLDNRYHFTVDAASTHENAKCDRHFTVEEDGLLMPWGGERVFCNPPYGRAIRDWVKKCSEETDAFITLLIPARTDTSYFHDYIYMKPNVRIEFLRGRIKFEQDGMARQSAPFPSMLVYFNEKLLEDMT